MQIRQWSMASRYLLLVPSISVVSVWCEQVPKDGGRACIIGHPVLAQKTWKRLEICNAWKYLGKNLPLGLYTYGVENCSWPKLCIVNTNRKTVVRPRSNTHQYEHLDSWLRSCQSIITNHQIKNPITTWSFSAYGPCKNVSSTHLETNSFVQSHPVPIHIFLICMSVYI